MQIKVTTFSVKIKKEVRQTVANYFNVKIRPYVEELNEIDVGQLLMDHIVPRYEADAIKNLVNYARASNTLSPFLNHYIRIPLIIKTDVRTEGSSVPVTLSYIWRPTNNYPDRRFAYVNDATNLLYRTITIGNRAAYTVIEPYITPIAHLLRARHEIDTALAVFFGSHTNIPHALNDWPALEYLLPPDIKKRIDAGRIIRSTKKLAYSSIISDRYSGWVTALKLQGVDFYTLPKVDLHNVGLE